MSLIESRSTFSRTVLVRLVIVSALLAVALALSAGFIADVYFRNQLTAVGWIVNGGILVLFLLGMARIVAVLLRYAREERAVSKFVRALDEEDPHPDAHIDPRSLIALRYDAVVNLSREKKAVNHASLASAQVARESTVISFPKFINNILILTGVFGTIVALSMALLGASNLLGTAQEGPGNMGMVIHGMSTALSTTITAIVCYLIFGYFYLKLTDAQTRLLSDIEEVTTLYLLPRYATTPDTLLQQVSGLVEGLGDVAEAMRTIQADYLTISSQLHGLIAAMNQHQKPMAEDLTRIKGLLREGFRLPELETVRSEEPGAGSKS